MRDASPLTIQGAKLPDGTRRDLFIKNGVFVDELDRGSRVIDADGLQALPGLVDLHTHLREPGAETSETVASGTRAAAAGGFTAVFAMANTLPVADNSAVVEQVAQLGKRAGYAEVQPIGAATVGLAGTQIADLEGMAASRAKVRVFSDDGNCVFDPKIMRDVLQRTASLGGVLAQHAQEPLLTEGAQVNEGAASEKLGLPGWPAVAEETIVARDAILAGETGARLHICHVSTAGSVEVVRWAKARGISITAEVTPHHLLLTDQLSLTKDARYKVNPPLRREEDVYALRTAVREGTIDIIATDHAPHPADKKTCSWESATNGMVGLETALSVVQQTLVDTGHLDWVDVARVLSIKPAAIGGLPGYERPFHAGNAANFTLYDATVKRQFTASELRGKSLNSPYLRRTLPGRVVATVYNGAPTFLDGRLQ